MFEELVRFRHGLERLAYGQAWPPAFLQRHGNPGLPDGEGSVRNGMRHTTGFVESLSRLIAMDWTVRDFGTLCRRQKALAVNIRYQG